MRLKTKFEDEDFEFGEVVDAELVTTPRLKVTTYASDGGKHTFFYASKSEFDEDWEDVPEEPEEYWIPMSDEPYPFVGNDWEKEGLATGLISLSKEENDRKRQKFKAWERLKDKGFRFVGWCDSVSDNNPDMALFKLDEDAWGTDTCEDLDLLFRGEE